MGRNRSDRGQGGWSRRDFLTRAGVGAAVAPLAACGSSEMIAGLGPTPPVFQHSVASGDPLTDRVILWTRVSPPPDVRGDIPATVTVADDPDLTVNARTMAVTAVASRDWTIKHDAPNLLPGRTYYYRFEALGQRSPVGRTRTAPTDAARMRVAVVSCSNYPVGYFNAYRFIGQRDDLDLVLHLGDYLYEGGSAGSLGRPHDPPREILLLEDYRQRHAQYKADPDLQEAHRQHPWIPVWDDHESTNNSRRDSAQNHTEGPIAEGGEGIWQVRKAWAQQAYDEWMPIRLPEPGNANRIWRHFQFSPLLDLWMLDTRLFDRDDELGINDPANFAPDRRMIGPEQRQWLLDGLSASTSIWKYIGQQVMFGQFKLTPLPDLPLPSQLANLPIPLLLASGDGLTDVYVNPDQWDGYPAERTAILDHLRDEAIDNTVVLTGDIHTSWVMDLTHDPDNLLRYNPLTGLGSLAVEFVGTSVTSTGLDQLASVPDLANAVRVLNPHMKYVEVTRRGYMLLDVTPAETVCEYWYVSTVTEPGGTEAFAVGYATLAGSNRIAPLPRRNPTMPRSDAPLLAP